MNWRPMATMPRDGTPVLLLAPDGRRGIGYWRSGQFAGTQIEASSCAWIGPDRWNNGKTNVSMGGFGVEDALSWLPMPDVPTVLP